MLDLGVGVIAPKSLRTCRQEERIVATPSSQQLLIEVDAWDINCHQHIPRKLAIEDVATAIESLESRIRALEAENAALRLRTTDSQLRTSDHD